MAIAVAFVPSLFFHGLRMRVSIYDAFVAAILRFLSLGSRLLKRKKPLWKKGYSTCPCSATALERQLSLSGNLKHKMCALRPGALSMAAAVDRGTH